MEKRTITSLALVFGLALTSTVRAADPTPAEARAIAKEAYVYGFPLVDNYRIQYGYFVDTKNPEYKTTWNKIHNVPRVYTPKDTAIQTPNSDTPYSFVGMDLRAEPVVLTVPPIEKERYFSIQLIDAYTFNFDYIGSRATGNEGGSYMVAGPNWKGETPKGVKKVFHSETEFVFAVYRTQLFKPDDLDNVKKVQAGYKVQTLSAFLGTAAPKEAPAIDFIKPLTPAEEKTSPQFFNILGATTGAERHPNSHQRMMSFEGSGDMQVQAGSSAPNNEGWQSNMLISDSGAPLEKRWISIPQNVWHQPVISKEADWVVVSFHTVPAEELIEERPESRGRERTKQMRYLG
jgi:hypothetical protein